MSGRIMPAVWQRVRFTYAQQAFLRNHVGRVQTVGLQIVG